MDNDYKTIAEYEKMKKRQIKESWTPQQERILKIWAEKASGWAWLHERSSRYYNRLTNRFSYPSIILSTMSGGLGFLMGGQEMTVANIEGKDGGRMQSVNYYLTFTISIMNLMSAILVSLQKFKRTSELAEMHSHMNKMFSSFYRKIVLELALQPGDRKDCLEFCKQCREEYDKLVNDAPDIPSHIITAFKGTFDDANHVPEIANGLVHFMDTGGSNRRRSYIIDATLVDANEEDFVNSFRKDVV